MSRGLGELQAEILETLEEARQAGQCYSGGRSGPYSEPGWVTVRGLVVKLHDNVFDLRASREYLARKHDLDPYDGSAASFQASFSRAVKALIKRGQLVPLVDRVPAQVIRVPKEAEQERGRIVEEPDFLYIQADLKQVRFVMRPG